MKKARIFILIVSIACFAAACKSAPKSTTAGPTDTPEWLNDLPPDGVLWGIGTAKQTSSSMSMTAAEARARVSVARQLSTKVQAMFVDYNLDAGNVGRQANTSLQEDVSRQITNIDLTGARPIKRWQSKDGTWWYLVEMNKSDIMSQVANIMGNEEAAFAEFKAKQALDILDSHLSKKEKPLQVND